MKFETLATHVGSEPDPTYGAVIPPVYQTSTFAFKDVGKPGPFDYTRTGNPTRKSLEDCLAALEGGRHGFAFASGMAAVATVLALPSAGDHVIAQLDLYGGTYRLLTGVTQRQGVEVEFVDLRDLDALAAALRDNTKLVWAETPTNPLMRLLDLRAIAGLAREHGAITACDNTFLSPYFQRPLEHGIDLVVHSTTKYINGHSDVVGGAIVADDPQLAERIFFLQNAMGTGQAPLDAFLVSRGVKTLAVRMAAHDRSALAVARYLEGHAAVAEVLHPGLESHPQHDLAVRQASGSGGTFSFRVHGGARAALALLGAVELFTLAESLGGVESLIEHPATMTHAAMSPDVQRAVGITDDLIRVSVGLEHVDDLIADLEQALASAQRAVISDVTDR
jgi:cystathionine gamma-lyase